MMKRSFILLGLIALLQGCAFSVHQVHVSGFDPYTAKTKGVVVTAQAERFSVMGFNSDTSYVDNAYAQLRKNCPDSDIVGVSTEIQTALGFFSWTDRIYLRGLCVSPDAKQSKKSSEAS